MSNKTPIFIAEVAKKLKAQYHDFDHFNKSDPLDELLFILCSIKTSNKSYIKTFDKLKRKFPTHSSLLYAPHEKISKVLAGSGLQNQKASAIRNLLKEINQKFGQPTLDPLRNLSNHEVEAYLTSLPGVGKKVSRCVMMYSLKRLVFPIDTHCWRIFRRLGWARRTTPDGSCSNKDMDRLQSKVPKDLRFSLHVNMVSLGREFCLPRRPKCDDCPIKKLCPKIGTKNKLLFRT